MTYAELKQQYEEKAREAEALLQACQTTDGGLQATDEQRERMLQLAKELPLLKQQLESLREQELPALAENLRSVHAEIKAEIEREAKRRAPMAQPQTQELPSIGKAIADEIRKRGGARGQVINKTFEIDLKAAFTRAAGWAPQAIRTDRVVLSPQRALNLIDVVQILPTDQSAVVYMEETTATFAAAETAENAAYPEATFVLTERSVTVQKIAVNIPVTDEQLEDVAQAEAYLNNRLIYGVRQRLESQMLNGNGTAPNLLGILNATGVQTFARSTTPRIDALRDAIARCRGKGATPGFASPDLIVIHDADWLDLLGEKDTTGRYLFGDPLIGIPPNLDGIPFIITSAIPENTVLVGDFTNFHFVAQRRDVDVQVGYTGNDFTNGRRTIRADIRVANVVLRPRAFCSITGF